MYSISEKEYVYITKYLSLSFALSFSLFQSNSVTAHINLYITSRVQATCTSSISGGSSFCVLCIQQKNTNFFGFLKKKCTATTFPFSKPHHSTDVIVALPLLTGALTVSVITPNTIMAQKRSIHSRCTSTKVHKRVTLSKKKIYFFPHNSTADA